MSMKNELLVRAIGELDEELLEEAHSPVSKKKHTIAIVSRLAAVAACFAVILVLAMAPFGNRNEISIHVNGTALMADNSMEIPLAPAALMADNSMEIPLAPAAQQRQTAKQELSLHIAADGKEVSVSAGAGSAIHDPDGRECETLVLSEDTEIVWLLDIRTQDSFDLTLHWSDQTIQLTANIDRTENTLVVNIAS